MRMPPKTPRNSETPDGGNAMMADKQLNFRQDYRARIAGWYNGYVHIAVIYVIGGTALYIYSQHMGQVL